MIRKGDRVSFKPEWQDDGDSDIEFVAIEDECAGVVLVEARINLAFNPLQYVETRMIEGTDNDQ